MTTTSSLPAVTGADTVAGARGPGRRVLVGLGVVAGAVLLFLMYLRMSQAQPARSDAASNALQAWDMLHGNLFLHGWTVTDVSFWTTELPEFALVELFVGLQANVAHLAAALTYVLLVLLVAALARGRATGRPAVMRVALAVAVLVAPAPGWGYHMLLTEPDHIGTAVPVLATLLVLQRTSRARWAVPLVTLLLVWGQLGDPLAMFVGAVPLTLVCLVRLITAMRRDRGAWRGLDAGLALAGPVSALVTFGVLKVVHHFGGFSMHPPQAAFAPLSLLGHNLRVTAQSWAILFGAYFPDLHTWPERLVGALHVVLAVLCAVAVAVTLVRSVRRGADEDENEQVDRVGVVLAAGVLVNLAAFVLSTQPGGLDTSRQIAPALGMTAVLAGRVWGGPIARLRLVPVLGVVLAALLVAGTVQAVSVHPKRAEAADVAAWLHQRGLTQGIGAYWAANIITLETHGAVRVAPMAPYGGFSGDALSNNGYRWESRADWYDPARSDARFIVFSRAEPLAANQDVARRRFGTPVEESDFDGYVVWVFDHNILGALPADCAPGVVAHMADCPPLRPELPGAAIITG